MKKKIYSLVAAVSLLILLSSSLAHASLDIDVTVGQPLITPLSNQQITITTNEGGFGILLVLQPATGTPWSDFLHAHPALEALWNLLPSNVKTDIGDKIGQKIVSFKLVTMNSGGGTKDYSFPTDFDGINGDPSTALSGQYKIIFAFIGMNSGHCMVFEKDFDCGSWFVVPEVPFGTVATLLSLLVALSGFGLYKKRRSFTP
jgi:hypothetical protein